MDERLVVGVRRKWNLNKLNCDYDCFDMEM